MRASFDFMSLLLGSISGFVLSFLPTIAGCFELPPAYRPLVVEQLPPGAAEVELYRGRTAEGRHGNRGGEGGGGEGGEVLLDIEGGAERLAVEGEAWQAVHHRKGSKHGPNSGCAGTRSLQCSLFSGRSVGVTSRVHESDDDLRRPSHLAAVGIQPAANARSRQPSKPWEVGNTCPAGRSRRSRCRASSRPRPQSATART